MGKALSALLATRTVFAFGAARADDGTTSRAPAPAAVQTVEITAPAGAVCTFYDANPQRRASLPFRLAQAALR